jgi:hypothetical protein
MAFTRARSNGKRCTVCAAPRTLASGAGLHLARTGLNAAQECFHF